MNKQEMIRCTKRKEKILNTLYDKYILKYESFKDFISNDHNIDINKAIYNDDIIDWLIKNLYNHIFYYRIKDDIIFVYYILRNNLKVKGDICIETLNELQIRVGIINNDDYSKYIWIEKDKKLVSPIVLLPDDCLWKHGLDSINCF